MQRTGVKPITECRAYRLYLIRYSALSGRFWVERDHHFIGWATSEADAVRIIDLLAGEAR